MLGTIAVIVMLPTVCGRLFHIHSNLRSILSRLLIDISLERSERKWSFLLRNGAFLRLHHQLQNDIIGGVIHQHTQCHSSAKDYFEKSSRPTEISKTIVEQPDNIALTIKYQWCFIDIGLVYLVSAKIVFSFWKAKTQENKLWIIRN